MTKCQRFLCLPPPDLPATTQTLPRHPLQHDAAMLEKNNGGTTNLPADEHLSSGKDQKQAGHQVQTPSNQTAPTAQVKRKGRRNFELEITAKPPQIVECESSAPERCRGTRKYGPRSWD